MDGDVAKWCGEWMMVVWWTPLFIPPRKIENMNPLYVDHNLVEIMANPVAIQGNPLA